MGKPIKIDLIRDKSSVNLQQNETVEILNGFGDVLFIATQKKEMSAAKFQQIETQIANCNQGLNTPVGHLKTLTEFINTHFEVEQVMDDAEFDLPAASSLLYTFMKQIVEKKQENKKK